MKPLRYAIFCYDSEAAIEAWTKARDEEVMTKHGHTNRRLIDERKLGPHLRLMPTTTAVSIRAGEEPLILDGPFAETKEQLLGLWVIECDTLEEAIEAGRELSNNKGTGTLEIRPLRFYAEGAALP